MPVFYVTIDRIEGNRRLVRMGRSRRAVLRDRPCRMYEQRRERCSVRTSVTKEAMVPAMSLMANSLPSPRYAERKCVLIA